VTLSIDNWRWAGVSFMLRTGKALGCDRRELAIHFKPVPHLAFGQEAQPIPNVLAIELDPDRIALSVNVNEPGDLCNLEQVELDKRFPSGGLPAYARLLLDVLDGDPTLSIRDDEAEESWRIVELILQVWANGGVPLIDYPADQVVRWRSDLWHKQRTGYCPTLESVEKTISSTGICSRAGLKP